MVVNLLRNSGGQFAPENRLKKPFLQVVNLDRNQVVNLSGISIIRHILK